jgi:hypothetical protein
MDADFSHNPAVLTDMAERIKFCDVVIGSRYVEGGSVARRWPMAKKAFCFWEFLCPLDPRHTPARCDHRLSHVATGNPAKHAVGTDSLEWLRFPGGNGLPGVLPGIPDRRGSHPFRGPALGQVENVLQDPVRSSLARLAGMVELSRCAPGRAESAPRCPP